MFGLTTGFRELDHMLTGLPPGCLMIVAARPSMGKTSFALDVARHVGGDRGHRERVRQLNRLAGVARRAHSPLERRPGRGPVTLQYGQEPTDEIRPAKRLGISRP